MAEHANDEVVEAINEQARRRIALEDSLQRATEEFKADQAALKVSYEARLTDIRAQIQDADTRLHELIGSNRSTLIAKGKKFFTTLVAKFQFKESPSGFKLADGVDTDVMDVARRLGVVRQIADPPTFQWKFSARKFYAWLKLHPKMVDHFEEFLEMTPEDETLSMQPNDTYVVFHDKKRKTPNSISIKKS